MSVRKLPLLAVVSVVGALITMIVFAASSAAAPSDSGYPPPPPAGSVSDQTPVAGSTITVSGSGFLAGETVDCVLHSAAVDLGSAQADANGNVSLVVTLPTGVTGAHTIVLTGETSGRTVSIPITIQAASAGGSGGSGGSGGGGGGLASTGVAVLGIGGLGVVLLIGGGFLLLAGKRRGVHA